MKEKMIERYKKAVWAYFSYNGDSEGKTIKHYIIREYEDILVEEYGMDVGTINMMFQSLYNEYYIKGSESKEDKEYNVCSGSYLNAFTDDGKYDLFIISNEGNKVVDEDKGLQEAWDYLEDNNILAMTGEELRKNIEEAYFPYGIQILIKEKGSDNKYIKQ